jgi:hypothetical protein
MGIAWALCGNGMVHDMPIGFWIAAYRYQMAGGRFLPCHKHFDTRIFNSKKMWQALKRGESRGGTPMVHVNSDERCETAFVTIGSGGKAAKKSTAFPPLPLPLPSHK